MLTHSFLQNSPEWHAHRASHFNASDAPAMLGISLYKSRSQLLTEIYTGVTQDVDSATERKFQDGHRFERLARPIAENIIDDDLFPVVVSEGKLSASLDGLTIDGTICWEHKSLNETLRAALSASQIPAQYCAQMEQQLMISGATKCLFMASRWDEEDTIEEEMHCWYESDAVMRDRILAGWAQFEIDLENYQTQEFIPAAVAQPIKDLPSVLIEVKGEIRIKDNLTLFADLLKQYISDIDKEPNDDQGFADMKAGITALKKAEDALESGEQHALAQISTFDEMRRMKKSLQDLARVNRLQWEKIVVAQEKKIKEEIALSAKSELASHIDGLNMLIGKPYMPFVSADFAGAMKNQRTIKSLREKVSNELVRAKMESSSIAQNICINMQSLKELAKDYMSLFSDAGTLVLKANDDFIALIKMRIEEYKKAESAKLEAQRAAIQADEERKAKAAADAEIARAKAEQEAAHKAEIVKVEAESRFKAQKESEEKRSAEIETKRKEIQLAESAAAQRSMHITQYDKVTENSLAEKAHAITGSGTIRNPRPTRIEIIDVVANYYCVSTSQVETWLDQDFSMIQE